MRHAVLVLVLVPALAAAKPIKPDLQTAQNTATIWLNAVLTQRIDALAARTITPLRQVGLQHSQAKVAKVCAIPETVASRAALEDMLACLGTDKAFLDALREWRKIPFAWREASPKDAPKARFERLAASHTFVMTVVQGAGFKATLVLAMLGDGAVGALVDGISADYAATKPPPR